MLQNAPGSNGPLRIMHVLRAPVGGLFRHVLDLSSEQIARGHQVGVIADSLTGGEMAERQLAALSPRLDLGLMRLPIHRLPHPSDVTALLAINRRLNKMRPDVVHGHGSKGGLFARSSGLMSGRASPIRVYTPHGGSLNYRNGSLSHKLFMATERLLSYRTDALLFESAFIAGRFETFVGHPHHLARIIPNGISEVELEPVAPQADAADLLYVGEFRSAKGLDTLIDALALLAEKNIRPKTLLVGDGPERAALEARARRAGVASLMSFKSSMPARAAFALGKVMVVPSRFESLPYIVLEAAGARIPLVATNVGGMSEIFGPYKDRLIAADDPAILADALRQALDEPPQEQRDNAGRLAEFVAARFSISTMVDQILQGYRDAIAARAIK
ncbi:glycosyltransferase family 4 protein [Methylocystis sp. WRRC1]|uniref:glycosyltransferase family 4 protein n=1 Tax=Methylocystis sp. WRRC1 TaxID=1732014 RepID=UPI001D1558F3|nr:glycosyltransferase family 4 protein [Methylocystis sp. WRRC1]